MTSKRLFIVNRYVYPDHSATSQLVTDLADAMSGHGWQVCLLGSRQGYDAAGASFAAEENAHGFRILRVGGAGFGRTQLWGRLIDYLGFAREARRRLSKEVERGDTVIVMTDPPLLAAMLSGSLRRRGARMICWMQDLFPEIAEELLLPAWCRRWLLAPLRWWRNRALAAADQVVVISALMAARVRLHGVAESRLRVVENWSDDDAIRPLPRDDNALRAEWGLSDEFVIAYSGNLGRAHDWRTMLEAANALRARSDIRFLLIGGGHGQQAFAAAAAARGLDNVKLQPYQPRELLNTSLAVADAHWLSLLPSLEGMIFPSKLYGILAAGRPALLIGDVDGEVAQRLKQSGAGVSVAPGDSVAAVAVIEHWVKHPRSAPAMGQAARRSLDAAGGRSQSLDDWRQLIEGGNGSG